MFLNPMDRHAYRHDDEYTEYVAVDIGGLLNFDQLTVLIQQAAAKLPANQQLKAGENWGYYIRVHTKERTAEAVIVRPYPYKTWAWIVAVGLISAKLIASGLLLNMLPGLA